MTKLMFQQKLNKNLRKYLFIREPVSSRRGNREPFVEKCQVNGTGRFDDVTNSVLP